MTRYAVDKDGRLLVAYKDVPLSPLMMTFIPKTVHFQNEKTVYVLVEDALPLIREERDCATGEKKELYTLVVLRLEWLLANPPTSSEVKVPDHLVWKEKESSR